MGEKRAYKRKGEKEFVIRKKKKGEKRVVTSEGKGYNIIYDDCIFKWEKFLLPFRIFIFFLPLYSNLIKKEGEEKGKKITFSR